MSYILEALRKADEERNLGRVPDLQGAPMDVYPRRRRIWPWLTGLLVVLVVNALVLLVVFKPQFFQETEVTAQSASMPLAENTASSSALSGPAQQERSASNTPPQSAPVVVLPPPPLESPAVAANSSSPSTGAWQARPQTDSSELANAAVLPELSTGAPAVPPVSLNDPNWDAQSLATLSALPVELQRNLPKLNLDVHVYSQTAGKRFVLINANRYQEGEQLNEGPRLEAITADGAVLSYQGQRFLLPVYR